MKHLRVVLGLLLIVSQPSECRAQAWHQYRDEAESAMRARNYSKAIESWSKALKKLSGPDDPRYNISVGGLENAKRLKDNPCEPVHQIDNGSKLNESFEVLQFGKGAQKERLPPGHYIFLGQSPGLEPSRRLIVAEDGSFNWQADGEGSKGLSARNGAPADGAFEEYAYPFVKWKAKPIAGLPGAFAQLSTTFDRNGYGSGEIRYRLILFKASNVPSRIEVELTDSHEFKLFEFSTYSFNQIPGTSIREAKGTINSYSNEADYKKARDYSVSARTSYY